MANRYWVGGTSSWDTTAGTKWALTSGGAGGQAVPTLADDVFFTGASGTGTITINVAANAKSVDFTGFSGTLISTATLNIAGGLTLSPTMTLTLNGVFWIFAATNDNGGVGWPITTNGKIFNSGPANTLAFSGVGGKWVFQDAVNFGTSGTLTLTAGTLDTNGKTVTAGNLTSSGVGVKSLILGSSTVSLILANTPINMAGTNQTLSAAASTVYVTPTTNPGNWGSTTGFVWGNVIMQNAGNAQLGPLTCANFTRTGTATKTDALTLSGNIICSGTFTCTGNSVINRMSMATNVAGNGFVVIAASYAVTNTDLMDISFSGHAYGSVITSDSFNRANGSLGGSTTDTAAGGAAKVWSAPSVGTWNISSNQVQTTISTTMGAITVDAGKRDVAVEAKIVNLGPSGSTGWFLVAGFVSSAYYYVVRISQTGALGIGYVFNNSLTYSTVTGVTVTAGSVVGMELVGPNVIVRVNGAVVGISNGTVALQSQIQGTRVGFASTNNNTALIQFDDFKVSELSPAVSLTSCGDALGNNNIDFPPSVNRYAVAPGNWSSTAMWSASSGGSPGASVPLPQDNVFFDALSASGNYIADMPRLGADMIFTGFTRTFTIPNSVSFYGTITLSSSMTLTVTGVTQINMRGRSTHTITTAGKTWTDNGYGTQIIAPGGSYSLQDNWLGASFFLTVLAGTFNTNSYDISGSAFQASGSAARVVNFGTTTITLTYSTFWTVSGASYAVNAQNSVIVLSPNTTGFRTFTGGNVIYGTLRHVVPTSLHQLNISGNNYFDTLEIGPQRSIVFTSTSQNTVKNWIASGVNNGFQTFTGGQSGTSAGVYINDALVLRVTGDISIVAKLTMPTWTTGAFGCIVAKNNTALTAGYVFRVGATGFLNVFIGNAQATSSTSVTGVFGSGGTGWVRFSWSDSANLVTFYTSPDGVTWTQLGTTVALASVGIPTSTDTLYIGQRNTNDPLSGSMHRLIIYSDTSLTTKVIDVDFSTKPFGANTFTESSLNALTVNITGPLCQAGDGRVLVSSLTAASPAYLELVGPIDTLDYQTVQDIYSTIPLKYYAGASSVSISGNTNVEFSAPLPSQPYIVRQSDITNNVNTLSAVFPFGTSATSGNLLVVAYTSLTNPGVVTTPAGYTLIDSISFTAGTAPVFTFSKIASGGETSVQIVSTAIAYGTIKFFEIGGFSGTPLLDAKDKAAHTIVGNLNLATGTGVTNTGNPAIALAYWGMNGGMGASISFSNGYKEARWATQMTNLHVAIKLLTTLSSNTTTHTWTTSRSGSAQLIIFSGLTISGGDHNLPMLGVGS